MQCSHRAARNPKTHLHAAHAAAHAHGRRLLPHHHASAVAAVLPPAAVALLHRHGASCRPAVYHHGPAAAAADARAKRAAPLAGATKAWAALAWAPRKEAPAAAAGALAGGAWPPPPRRRPAGREASRVSWAWRARGRHAAQLAWRQAALGPRPLARRLGRGRRAAAGAASLLAALGGRVATGDSGAPLERGVGVKQKGEKAVGGGLLLLEQQLQLAGRVAEGGTHLQAAAWLGVAFFVALGGARRGGEDGRVWGAVRRSVPLGPSRPPLPPRCAAPSRPSLPARCGASRTTRPVP